MARLRAPVSDRRLVDLGTFNSHRLPLNRRSLRQSSSLSQRRNIRPEAQEARVQGEVTLKVRFLASGQVEVIGVVNGLGHGLDEEARHVAENIRFKPAIRNGQPVDHTTLIHVTFQLA